MKNRKVRKWIWLFIWVLTLVGISFYGGAVSYGLFWGVLLLPIISFIYLLYVYLRFSIYQEVESRQLVCGQPVPYYFVLRNEDKLGFAGIAVRMFPDYFYVEELAEDAEYELLPGDEVVHRTKLICKYRGEYEVGVKEVIISDFLGLFRFKYPIPGAIRAIVRPKLVELSELKSLPDVVELNRESLMAHNEPDVVVRDYMPGDGLKKIHWKASSHAGKLLVRKDTGTEKQGVTVLLDTHRYSEVKREYLPRESKLLEVLLALTYFWSGKQVPFTAFYGQNRPVRMNVAGLDQFERFYQAVSDISFDSRESSRDLMRQVYPNGMPGNDTICVCVFSSWNDELMAMTDELVDAGMYVVAYVVTDEQLDEYIRYNSERKKIIEIPVEAELEGVM